MRAWGSMLIATAAVLLLEPAAALAQLGDRITVPLSKPGQPATLKVSLISGSIAVTAYDGNEVLIEPQVRDQDEKERAHEELEREREREERRREREQARLEREAARRGDRTPRPDDEVDRGDPTAGLRRLQNRSAGVSVEEHDNEVTVTSPWHSRSVDLDIKVPVATSVHLMTINDGDIVVRNVRGEIEAQNTNGRVVLTRVTGPVVAHALNGDVVASLGGPMPDRPTSLSSMNGDIDLTLPANAKASLWIRADNGEIYTDFDLKLESRNAPQDDGDTDRKRKRHKGSYSVETGMAGTLNGGGAEIRLQTFNGSVYVRRAK